MSHLEEPVDDASAQVLARGRLHRLKESAAGFVVRRPVSCLLVTQLLLLLPLFVVSYKAVVDVDFGAFMYRGTNASLYHESYEHAWQFSNLAPRNKLRHAALGLIEGMPDEALFSFPPGTHSGNPSVDSNLSYVHFTVHLLYNQVDGGNILKEKTLHAIQQYEDAIRAGPLWQDLCKSNGHINHTPWSCDPGESLIGYVWPESMGDEGQREGLRLSGHGTQWLPVDVVLAALAAGGEPLDRTHRFLPQDLPTPASTDTLQSHFLFSLPVGSRAKFANEEDARSAFQTFVKEELHPALEGSDLLNLENVRVLAHGTGLLDLAVGLALHRDFLLVIGSMIVALVIFYVHARSIPLACFGLLLVMESLPLSFLAFWLIVGSMRVNLANAIALFVVAGLGSDAAVFGFLDSWHELRRREPEEAKTLRAGPARRPSDLVSDGSFDKAFRTHCMRVFFGCICECSLAPCAVATACIASSFFACLTSSLRWVRELGLFLGLCVVFSAILVVAMYPVAIVALESWRFGSHPKGAGDDRGEPLVTPGESTVGWKARAKKLNAEVWQVWTSSLSVLRWWLLGVLAIASLVCLIITPLTASLDATPSALFPSGHNQAAGQLLREGFGDAVAAVAFSPNPQNASFCGLAAPQHGPEWQRCRDDDLRCGTWASLGQCEAPWAQARCPRSCGTCSFCLLRRCRASAPPEPPPGNATGCSCYSPGAAKYPAVRATIVGAPREHWPHMEPALTPLLEGVLLENDTGYSYDSDEAWPQPPLFQQHWRSGRFAMWPTFEAPVLLGTSADMPSAGFVKSVVCYCGGISPCSDAGLLQGSFDYSLNETESEAAGAGWGIPDRRLDVAQSRRLGQVDLRHADLKVAIVWGVLVAEPSPVVLFPRARADEIWHMDGMFDPSDPWVQRSMMVMCSGLTAELRAVPQEAPGPTWLQLFELWLLQRGDSYPSRDFHRQVAEFLLEQPLHQRNLLVEDGVVRAVSAAFVVEVPLSPTLRELGRLKNAWDTYVEAGNRRASLRAKGAWHTSQLWVLLETQWAVTDSIWFALLVLAIAALVVAAVYTRDGRLTLIFLASSASVLLFQACFISSVLHWALGPLEAVAITAFSGQGLAASLRVLGAYGHAPQEGLQSPGKIFSYSMRFEGTTGTAAVGDRFGRTLHALEATGWGALRSAAMMLGTGLFMLLCTLQLQVRLGVAVLSITAFSLMHSLLFLPLVLLLVGPTPHGFQPLTTCGSWLRALRPESSTPVTLKEPELGLPAELDDTGSDAERRTQLTALGMPVGVCLNAPLPPSTLTSEVGASGACLFLNGSHSARRQEAPRQQRQGDNAQSRGCELVDLDL